MFTGLIYMATFISSTTYGPGRRISLSKEDIRRAVVMILILADDIVWNIMSFRPVTDGSTICVYGLGRLSMRVHNFFIRIDTYCVRVIFWIFLENVSSRIIILNDGVWVLRPDYDIICLFGASWCTTTFTTRFL